MPASSAGPSHCGVAIVGAGPAGLAAATRLRQRGVGSVVLIDREPEAGGIPRHCGHYPFGMREFHRLLRGPDYARRLAERAFKAGAAFLPATTVVRIAPGPELTLSSAEGTTMLTADRVLLATGVRETSRAARLIGGARLAGVLSTGALQSMVYLKGLTPFRRPVILGTELVSFSAIMTCRHAGIRPAAMVEEAPRVTAQVFARALPALTGIPLHLSTRVERIVGTTRVEGVVVTGPDGTSNEIEADGVIVTGRFTPEATLARMGHLAVDGASGGPSVDQYARCSDPAFYAAGNLLRPVETAGWSWQEGVAAGDTIADDLAGKLPQAQRGVALRVDHPALKFVVPQRIALPCEGRDAGTAQMRVTTPVRGRLTAESGGRTLWSRHISALPERRILLPLGDIAREAGDNVEFRFVGEQ